MSKPETNQSIEAKIAKLDEALEWFYSDDFNLDKAIEHYQAAINLSKSIKSDLDHLKTK